MSKEQLIKENPEERLSPTLMGEDFCSFHLIDRWFACKPLIKTLNEATTSLVPQWNILFIKESDGTLHVLIIIIIIIIIIITITIINN